MHSGSTGRTLGQGPAECHLNRRSRLGIPQRYFLMIPLRSPPGHGSQRLHRSRSVADDARSAFVDGDQIENNCLLSAPIVRKSALTMPSTYSLMIARRRPPARATKVPCQPFSDIASADLRRSPRPEELPLSVAFRRKRVHLAARRRIRTTVGRGLQHMSRRRRFVTYANERSRSMISLHEMLPSGSSTAWSAS